MSDARNDARLNAALAQLPRGSGFVFRHYHLHPDARRVRFDDLAAIARDAGHLVALSGRGEEARRWGADGIYGHAMLRPADGLIRLATAHDAAELQAANTAQADGVFLSPVFPTASHPHGRTLGAAAFLDLAGKSQVPVIALGGMTRARAEHLGWPRWGAIDGLAPPHAA
ncbi:MAG: thiamine phosphate synthase [Qipengyuania sp.]